MLDDIPESKITVLPGDGPSKLHLPFRIEESVWCCYIIGAEKPYWQNKETGEIRHEPPYEEEEMT